MTEERILRPRHAAPDFDPREIAAESQPTPETSEARHDQAPASYLQYMRVEHFGALSCRTVGPFAPGLNVVFGPNEAGKSTLAAFTDGVMFGWEEARGNRNTYKPAGANRAGSLLFAAKDDDSATFELHRERNADGAQGSTFLVEDIDRATYRTMFWLTSDELRSLNGAGDMTARFLTAGSGTETSPAHALAAIRERLARFTSRAASAKESLVNLTAERDQLRARLNEAAERADALRSQARELHDIEPQRRSLNAQLESTHAAIEALSAARAGIDKIDAETMSLEAEKERLHDEERRTVAQRRMRMRATGIEALSAARAGIDKIDAETMSLEAEKERLHDEERRTVAQRRMRMRATGAQLARMSGSEDRAVREKVEVLGERKAKVMHALETAQDAHRNATAAYEALVESADNRPRETHGHRLLQIGVSALLFALLIVVGVPLFVQGRNAGSLSYASLGLVMVFFGLVLAAAALVLLFKPDRRDEERKDRIDEAMRAMIQSKKTLEACEREAAEMEEAITANLEKMGLEEAAGSLRRARVLLDEAKDARAEMALDRQRQQAVSMRVDEVETRLEELARQRIALCERAGAPADADDETFDQKLSELNLSRAELLERTEAVNMRWGELSQELAGGADEHEFDRLKTSYQTVLTRLREATRSFAKTLIAQRMLEEAVSAWEAQSQPAVFAEAGRLLALMTRGRWTGVTLSDDGEVRVLDDARIAREPRLLSLGTCQQLYLALRISLLISAPGVGANVPVMADDILVNFDAARREGAARALLELARVRQVIFFTCHEEVLDVLSRASSKTSDGIRSIAL